MPNLVAGIETHRFRVPLIVSPRGMLSPEALKFSSARKRMVWALAQRRVVQRSDCLHVTSEQEHDEIRALGLSNPIAVIPNGIDVPEAIARESKREAERVVLFLGRIHPKKGLLALVHAWSQIERHMMGWRLRIVGPEEVGHAAEIACLAKQLGCTRLSIEGELRGANKWKAYRDADLFVLPTLNENFGLTVAEALASGTPVICTKGAPWSGLEEHRCGWWIDHSVEALRAALCRAMTLPIAELNQMGDWGRQWMEREFSWTHIGKQMFWTYRWLVDGGQPPSFVRLQ